MVTVWCTSHGVIHYSLMKSGETITAKTYCKDLEEMMKKLAEKQPRLMNQDKPILLHDNAKPHKANETKLQLLQLETDYHFFRNLDIFLQGKIFDSHDAVKNAFHEFVVSRSPGFFARGINELPIRWQMCVDALGAYFE